MCNWITWAGAPLDPLIAACPASGSILLQAGRSLFTFYIASMFEKQNQILAAILHTYKTDFLQKRIVKRRREASPGPRWWGQSCGGGWCCRCRGCWGCCSGCQASRRTGAWGNPAGTAGEQTEEGECWTAGRKRRNWVKTKPKADLFTKKAQTRGAGEGGTGSNILRNGIFYLPAFLLNPLSLKIIKTILTFKT